VTKRAARESESAVRCQKSKKRRDHLRHLEEKVSCGQKAVAGLSKGIFATAREKEGAGGMKKRGREYGKSTRDQKTLGVNIIEIKLQGLSRKIKSQGRSKKRNI